MQPILASAQQSLSRGFLRLDRAAQEVASAHIDQGNDGQDGASKAGDPMLRGLFDTFQAKSEIEAGVVLTHVYSKIQDDLKGLGKGKLDTYA